MKTSIPRIHSYCVKCRQKTGDLKPQLTRTTNGRKMIRSQCGTCGTKKCRFTK